MRPAWSSEARSRYRGKSLDDSRADVRPAGIEPALSVPQTEGLSVGLRAQSACIVTWRDYSDSKGIFSCNQSAALSNQVGSGF